MNHIKKHLIHSGSNIKSTLYLLENLPEEGIVFVVDKSNRLLGSITDGDIRRALIKNEISLHTLVDKVMNQFPKSITKNKIILEEILKFRESNYKIIPVIDEKKVIIDLLNFNNRKTILPVDTVIMAGGKGKRLAPLTNKIPKPLLKVGEKPIIQHIIDHLDYFGIENYWISINYLKEQLKSYFNENYKRVFFIEENSPLGTIGILSKKIKFKNHHILLSNSDIITNLDYEKFYFDFLKKKADISVVTIPYDVKIPFGIFNINKDHIIEIEEKPTYTYYSNAGIYLIKREALKFIPKNKFYNATDLIDKLIKMNKKVICYKFNGYWLDIGRLEDLEKAKQKFKKIKS